MKGFLYGLAIGLAISGSIGLANGPMLPTDPRGLDDFMLQQQRYQQEQEIEQLQRRMDQRRRSPC